MEEMMNPQMGMNEELETLSSQDMEEAKVAMGELINMIAEMKAAGEGLEKDWIKSANDRGLDGAMLVKTAKDLISKYDK